MFSYKNFVLDGSQCQSQEIQTNNNKYIPKNQPYPRYESQPQEQYHNYNQSSYQDIFNKYQNPYVEEKPQENLRRTQNFDINHKSLEKSKEKSKNKTHKIYGNDSDIPKKPSVLSTTKQQYSSIWKTKTKKHENESQKFYKYCTDEIVRVSNVNSELQKRVRRVENLLKQEELKNSSLKSENELVKQELSQVKKDLGVKKQESQKLKLYLQDESKYKTRKLREQIEKQDIERKRIQEMKQQFSKMIRDKDILNNQLLEEIKMLKMENIKNMGYIEENKRLHHRLGETIAKNQQLQQKKMKKTSNIEHLWAVKEIQYENLKNLLQLSKQQ